MLDASSFIFVTFRFAAPNAVARESEENDA
jgi:hypothetical protein